MIRPYVFLPALLILLANQSVSGQPEIPVYLESNNWDSVSKWQLYQSANASIQLQSFYGQQGDGLRADYTISPGSKETGWVIMAMDSVQDYLATRPVSLQLRTEATDEMEIKFIDSDGSVFGKRFSLRQHFTGWTSLAVYLDNTRYWWGGNTSFGELDRIELAFSGDSSGTVYIDEIGLGRPGLLPGILLDPLREATGTGFNQRRSAALTDEDPLVLEYLKVVQDSSSEEGNLLPSMEDAYISTFNNALAAMAFVLKGEKVRAEKILDFFAAATDINNQDKFRQNFYYNGEARGFFQQVTLPDYLPGWNEDRWMGDMAWLLLAYKYYEREYGFKSEYDNVAQLIKNLLISFYKPHGSGGYIQSGWQNGDTQLHESQGHPEGNIDCYAVFKTCGEDFYASQIRFWVDSVLSARPLDTGTGLYVDNNFPLDLYTWRVLAFGEQCKELLNIPDYDFRYRKSLPVNGTQVMGFLGSPDPGTSNFWLDGTGHIACAYQAFGEKPRGYFYANQYDSLLLEYQLHGITVRSLPYVLNKTGGSGWVDTTRGFVSVACWYIFAKNGFNPMDFDGIPNEIRSSSYGFSTTGLPVDVYPDPFNTSTGFHFSLERQSMVRLAIYALDGRVLSVLADRIMNPGTHAIIWDGRSNTGNLLPGGIYFYTLSIGPYNKSGKLVLIRD